MRKKIQPQNRLIWSLAVLAILVAPIFHLTVQYILPYFRVKPVLRKLSSPDMRQVVHGALNIRGLDFAGEYDMSNMIDIPRPIPPYGREAYLVEQKILSILPLIDDINTLDTLIFTIDSPAVSGGTYGLDFGKYGEAEWKIIRDAVERYNALLPTDSSMWFEVHKTNGIYAVRMIYESR